MARMSIQCWRSTSWVSRSQKRPIKHSDPFYQGVKLWSGLAIYFPDPMTEQELSADYPGLKLTGHADVASIIEHTEKSMPVFWIGNQGALNQIIALNYYPMRS